MHLPATYFINLPFSNAAFSHLFLLYIDETLGTSLLRLLARLNITPVVTGNNILYVLCIFLGSFVYLISESVMDEFLSSY